MNFLHYKIIATKGDLVRVKVSSPCFVRMLDPLSFEYYRVGRQFSGIGGWCDGTMQEYEIPYAGTWHVVIDMGKEQGAVKAVVDVIRK